MGVNATPQHGPRHGLKSSDTEAEELVACQNLPTQRLTLVGFEDAPAKAT